MDNNAKLGFTFQSLIWSRSHDNQKSKNHITKN